jgi:nucleoside-diphosphate-sugar epimerase
LASGVRRFIFTSTTAVYGPGLEFPETASCQPQGVYAQSKKQAENALLTAVERGIAVTIVRLGTLYGLASTMRFVSVVNRLAYLAGIKKTMTVYGDGRQMRSIIHVRDASDLLCFLLRQPVNPFPSVFNGVDQTVSILDVIETLQRLRPDISYRYTEQDIRTHLSFGAAGTAVRELGWQPKVTLESGLTEMLQQFRAFYSLSTTPSPISE